MPYARRLAGRSKWFSRPQPLAACQRHDRASRVGTSDGNVSNLLKASKKGKVPISKEARMPTKTSTKTVTCPVCKKYGATFRQHDTYIEEQDQPARRDLELACPNRCTPTPEELEHLRTGRLS